LGDIATRSRVLQSGADTPDGRITRTDDGLDPRHAERLRTSVRSIALLLAFALLPLGAGRAAAQNGSYVVVVNPRNPISRLTTTQLSRIYLGKLQGWDINGQIQPIAAVDQKSDSPLRAAFTQRVLRRSLSEAESYWRQEIYAGRNVPPPEQSEADALATVREMVGGIAYVSVNADLRGVKVVIVQ
jgi:hypothetical protein